MPIKHMKGIFDKNPTEKVK